VANVRFGRNQGNKSKFDSQEIKNRVNLGNASYLSAQNRFSSRLFSKSVDVKICKTKILPLVLHWCETWSHILREEHRLRVFEDRLVRRILGPKISYLVTRLDVTGERYEDTLSRQTVTWSILKPLC
jgi:hypothetical protein